MTEGDVQIPYKQVRTRRYSTSKVMVNKKQKSETYTLDDSERELVSNVLSTAASYVSARKISNRKLSQTEEITRNEGKHINSKRGKGGSA